jgi:hypothetical protein
MLLSLATARTEELAWRFLRLVGAIGLALSVASAAWSAKESGWLGWAESWPVAAGAVASAAAVGLMLAAPIGPSRPAVFRAIALGGSLTALAASFGLALTQLGATPPASAYALTILNQLLSALLLGSITVAWLLGHAYLTATKMTIAPLRHFSSLLTWAVIGRACFVAASLALGWLIGALPPGGSSDIVAGGGSGMAVGTLGFAEFLGRWWLFLVLRIGVGLIAVGVFAWMVRDCVRLRSTQSATGILYFGSIFAYVGEMAAYQLSLEWHWPV